MSKIAQDQMLLGGQLEISYNLFGASLNPLFKAALEGNAEQVKKLLQNNSYALSDLEAKGDAAWPSSLPLLAFAAAGGNLATVKSIVQFLEAQELTIPSLMPAINISLLFAALQDHPSVIDYLSKCGGDCNTNAQIIGLPNSLDTPITVALAKGHNEALRILLSRASFDESQLGSLLQAAFYSGDKIGIELILDKILYSSPTVSRESIGMILIFVLNRASKDNTFLPVASKMLTQFFEMSQSCLRSLCDDKRMQDIFRNVLSAIKHESPLLQQLFNEISPAYTISFQENGRLVKKPLVVVEGEKGKKEEERKTTIDFLTESAILTGTSTIHIRNLIQKLKESRIINTKEKIAALKLICPSHPEITLEPYLFRNMLANFRPALIRVSNVSVLNNRQGECVGLNVTGILDVLTVTLLNLPEIYQTYRLARDRMSVRALRNLEDFLNPWIDIGEGIFHIDRMIPFINSDERSNHILVKSGLSSICLFHSNATRDLIQKIFNCVGVSRLSKLKKEHGERIIQEIIQYCSALPEVQKAVKDREAFAHAITALRKTSDNVISELNAYTHDHSSIQQRLKALSSLSTFILKSLPCIKEGIESKVERPGRSTKKNALDAHGERERDCQSLSRRVYLLQSLYQSLCQKYERLWHKIHARRFTNDLHQAENETVSFERRVQHLSSAQHAFKKFERLLGLHRSGGLVHTRQGRLLSSADYSKQNLELEKLIQGELELFDFTWLAAELTTFNTALEERKAAHESLLKTYNQKLEADSKKEEYDKEKRERDLKEQQSEKERRQAQEKERLENQRKLVNELREKHLKWQREQEKRKKEREATNKKLAAMAAAAAAAANAATATTVVGTTASTSYSGTPSAEAHSRSIVSARKMMRRFNLRRAPTVLSLEAKTEFSKKIQESEKQRKLRAMLSGSLEELVKLISTLSFRADDIKVNKELESPELSALARVVERNALFEVLARTMELIIQLKGHHWFAIGLAKRIRNALYHEKSRNFLSPTEDNLRIIREIVMNVLNLLQGEIPKEAPIEAILVYQIQGNTSIAHWFSRLLMAYDQGLKMKSAGVIPPCAELKKELEAAQSELDRYVAFENFSPNVVKNPDSGLRQAIRFTRTRIGCIIREFCDHYRKELGGFDPDYLAFCYECLHDGVKIRHAKLKEEEVIIHTSGIFTSLPSMHDMTPFDRSSFISGFLTQLQMTRKRSEEAAALASATAESSMPAGAAHAGPATAATAAAAAAAARPTRS